MFVGFWLYLKSMLGLIWKDVGGVIRMIIGSRLRPGDPY